MITCKRRIFPISLALVLSLPLLCEAMVKGLCSNCHTMHNSQQGSPVAFTLDSAGQQVLRTEAFGKLLKTDCIGCHSDAGPETIITIGETRIPIVFNMNEPTYPPDGSQTSSLAGGNFHWLGQGNQYGHNIHGIAGQDSRFSFAPGGVPRSGECTTCHGSLSTPESACNGCHVPLHHADGASDVAGREEGWYRFLGAVMLRDGGPVAPAEGVVGIEDPNWEQNPFSNRHNTYQGKTGPYLGYLQSGSISQKCTGCHGLFHTETIANSTWIRHPVDVTVPDSGEFTEFADYNPMVPVARQNVSSTDANFSSINRGSDLISCISCHRPHGSPYPSMLRWGYRSWPGIDSHTGQPAVNGCAVCHTVKN